MAEDLSSSVAPEPVQPPGDVAAAEASPAAQAKQLQKGDDDAPSAAALQLDMHTDENVWMSQIGHLKDWCQDSTAILLQIPPAVTSTQLQAESLRLLYIFGNLQRLDILYTCPSSTIQQALVNACAELLHLQSLKISGGHLLSSGLRFGCLTSLRKLRHLAVRPYSDQVLDGLEDDDVASCARLTSLHSIDLRASENLTDEGLLALSSLTALTSLSLMPLGIYVTKEGVDRVLEALPSLASLSVGLQQALQVSALGGADAVRDMQLVVNDPEMNQASFFSTCTLCLRTNLVSLRLATLEATDASFMMALGTLSNLTELKMGVAAAEGAQPFTCSIARLSTLVNLQILDFAVTQSVALPISVKLVSILSLALPRLTSLSLSCMAKPELVPEALDLLDNFSQLRRLCLFAPLDFTRGATDVMLPVNIRYLPQRLEQLVLECAALQDTLATVTPSCSSSGVANGSAELESSTSAPQPPSASQLPERPAAPPGGGALTRQTSCQARAAAPVLPKLQGLELNDCTTSDVHLAAVLRSATGLRRLELNDVSGITGDSLSCLRGLTALEHLVAQLGRCTAVTHRSLTALHSLARLQHLEWQLANPISRIHMEDFAMAVLSSLGSLRYLSLDGVDEDRMAAAAPPPGSGSDGGGAPAPPSIRAQLQRALPLCRISNQQGIVMYNLWQDAMVTMTG